MNKVQPLIPRNARECLPFGTRYRLNAKRNFGMSLSVIPTAIAEVTDKNPRKVHRAFPQSGLGITDIRMDTSESSGDVGQLGTMTKTIDDGTVITGKINHLEMPSSIYSGGGDGFDGLKGITEFLGIPRVISSGVLSSTDMATTFTMIPTGYNLNSLAANYDKIKGFHSIRYDTVVTIEINGNRFQTGYYMLVHLPTGGIANHTHIAMHRYDKTVITQLPHVCFDINCDTKAQLTIPYVSGTNALKVTNSGAYNVQGDPGLFFIYPYVPLGSTAGSTTASYTMWVHYTNVKLFGAAIPQSGFRGGKRGKDLVDAEMKKPGPVENAMTMITDTATALSGVPLLSSIAGPVSWVSDAMRRTAKSFGWSKPLTIEPANRIINEVVPFMASSDAKSNATPLSLSVENHVDVAPGFGGTDLDELSIDFLKSIPSYYATYSWNTSDVRGTALANGYSLPSVYVTDTVDGGATVRSFTPIAFLASYFNQWRGGLRYHFKIVKTEFHSGRLLFAWSGVTNTYGAAIPTMTIAESEYVHKQIIDVREGSEFVIEVPYCSITNWNNTASENRNISGRWYLYVLDELKVPATVASNISIIMEVSGAPDLQFAVPKPFNYMPIVPITYQSGFGSECDLSSAMVGSSKEKSVNLLYNSLSVGETVTSLRQVLKRGGFLNGAAIGTTAVQMYPFAVSLLESQAAALPLGEMVIDPYNIISTFYALSRGGMRISSIAAAGDAVGLSFTAYSLMKLGDLVSAIASVPIITLSKLFWQDTNQGFNITRQSVGGSTVQIPQYTLGHSRGTLANAYSTSTPYAFVDFLADRSSIKTRRVQAGIISADYFYRAVSDDFNLGCFISIPVMYLTVTP